MHACIHVCMYACMCACMWVCMNACICVYPQMKIYMHTHTLIYVYIYIYMCVCVFLCAFCHTISFLLLSTLSPAHIHAANIRKEVNVLFRKNTHWLHRTKHWFSVNVPELLKTSRQTSIDVREDTLARPDVIKIHCRIHVFIVVMVLLFRIQRESWQPDPYDSYEWGSSYFDTSVAQVPSCRLPDASHTRFSSSEGLSLQVCGAEVYFRSGSVGDDRSYWNILPVIVWSCLQYGSSLPESGAALSNKHGFT